MRLHHRRARALLVARADRRTAQACNWQQWHSMIECQTRYTILLPNPDRQSNALIGRIGQAWQGLPEGSCRTVTFDRGTEFAAYAVLAKASGTEAYFCD